MQYNWENICRDLSVFIGLRYSWGNVAYIYWIAISWGNVDENCIYLLNWGNVLHIFIGLRYNWGNVAENCIYLLNCNIIWGNVCIYLLSCDIIGEKDYWEIFQYCEYFYLKNPERERERERER